MSMLFKYFSAFEAISSSHLHKTLSTVFTSKIFQCFIVLITETFHARLNNSDVNSWPLALDVCWSAKLRHHH